MKADGLPESLQVLSKIFSGNGHQLYLVGGFVRNIALGIDGSDVDVCSDARPEKALEFLRRAGLKVVEKALELGTIEVHLDFNGKKHVFEHTTFRRDFYPRGGNHRPERVAFTTDICEDAKRRDFTVNALYINIGTGEIIDPTNKGLQDIKTKTIRAAAENPEETIRDDGLRIMRMARFAAELGFSVSPDLLACAKKHAPLLNDISAERKRDELKKILVADTKYEVLTKDECAHRQGLFLLRQTGALPYILPRLSEGKGIAQSEVYHRYDVLGHGIHTCAAALPLIELRLAALLHDIGKPMALRQGNHMHGHELFGETLAKEELESLKFDNKTKRIVLPLVRNHMFDLEGRAKPKTIRRCAIRLGRDVFKLLIALRYADFMGSGYDTGSVISADNWQKELNRMVTLKVPWSIKEIAITGNEIMDILKIEPSPIVGNIMSTLFYECVVHPEFNNPQTLKKRALAIGKSLNLLM
ncbi:MAG: CCA tRNA nucleotidyltransferase [Christensenellales bacterium]|jgi:tRNA nucleotidyltransferase (CCA-adding enzyme)